MPEGKGTYGKQVGRPANKMEGKDKKNFKPHKMYCKDGSTHNAKTYKQHLALKNKGCGHKPMKKK
tara:strand:- start:82 stop:276 length:195 start_codon:yes stop_codon:yes gene_type:complete